MTGLTASSARRRGGARAYARWAGALAVGAGLAALPMAAGAAPAASSGHSTVSALSSGRSRGGRAAAPACKPGQLAVWIDSQGNGAAGSISYNLQFTNISTHTCALTGFPGVSAVNAAGRSVGAPAKRSPGHAVRSVHLKGASVVHGSMAALGGSAMATLQITDVDNYPAASCGRGAAVGLRVFAPNQKAAKLVSFPFLACTHHGVRYLSVGPVQPGR